MKMDPELELHLETMLLVKNSREYLVFEAIDDGMLTSEAMPLLKTELGMSTSQAVECLRDQFDGKFFCG